VNARNRNVTKPFHPVGIFDLFVLRPAAALISIARMLGEDAPLLAKMDAAAGRAIQILSQAAIEGGTPTAPIQCAEENGSDR
jgi:hypothetical protein